MSGADIAGKVQTVLGPIEPEALGVTLMHEHLLVDLECYFQVPDEASERAWIDAPLTIDRLGGIMHRWYYNRDIMRLWDVDTAIEEALRFRHAGGGSLVDVTSIGIGRDPLALARISRATGLTIVMGGSYYVPIAHPPDMDELTEDDITAQLVRDITAGVGDTGVRCGIIGEVGNSWPLSTNEKKVLRASARAHTETGAPISIHCPMNERAPQEILEILVGAGAEPEGVVMGHLGPAVNDRQNLKSLAETGCFLQYDHFGAFEDTSMRYLDSYDFNISDVQAIEKLEFLVGEGHAGQILISHDVCNKHMLARSGGHGITHILDSIVPRMRKRGFAAEHIDAMLVANPGRALAFR